MEKMYQEFKDLAEFRIVYIREAHPTDGRRPSRQATENDITQPVEHVERCKVAELLVKQGKLNIPCIIDSMDNKVDTAYSAKPDRAFLVDVDGKLAVAGGRGPRGFGPALTDIKKWLSEFKEKSTDTSKAGSDKKSGPDAKPVSGSDKKSESDTVSR